MLPPLIGTLQGIRTPDLLVRRDSQIVELHFIWWNLAELSDKSSVQETKRPISASVDMLGFMQKLIFRPFVRILLEQTTPYFWRRISCRMIITSCYPDITDNSCCCKWKFVLND